MGERKGVNKYYPPDYDPKKGGLNKFQGTHALRERARKLHLGILIIRFEMPYNIWCDGCKNHIGMGVRYNSEKKKIGMYYTTPVYQFRMKCHLCDNHFEIKTDPANLDYVIVSGARRQENRWDPTQNGQIVPEDKATIQKLYSDPMFKLEHGSADKESAKKQFGPRLIKLTSVQNRVKDDYGANCILRDSMRRLRRVRQKIKESDDKIRARNSFELELLPESVDDLESAKLLSFASKETPESRQRALRHKIDSSCSFSHLGCHSKRIDQQKEYLRKIIRKQNTKVINQNEEKNEKKKGKEEFRNDSLNKNSGLLSLLNNYGTSTDSE